MNNHAVVEYLLMRFPAPTRFIDQFTEAPENELGPRTRETIGKTFICNPRVRQTVLERATGLCEWCGQPGFETTIGSVYLETHHVIPLYEGGPDTESNVVAVCPNHHREAHHAKGRDAMRQEFLRRMG
jgi:predicted restriction endonuclease